MCGAQRKRAFFEQLESASKETSEILMTVGKIMMARIIEPARMLKPGPPRYSRINGTININPQKP